MDETIIQAGVETAKNVTSGLDKLADIAKNKSDLTYLKKSININQEDLKETIEIVKNSGIAMSLEKNGIKVYSPELLQFLEKTKNRFLWQEIMKQKNIDNVLIKTQEEIKNDAENGGNYLTEKSVNNDFVTQFFNCVGEISDEEMQKYWAKLLAGEIKNPNTYSYRTINKLKTLSREEAKKFEKISTFVFGFGYVPNNDEFLNKYGLHYSDLLELQDSEIITLVQTSNLSNNVIYNDKIAVFSLKEVSKNQKVNIRESIFCLTNFGKDLLKLIDINYNDDMYIDYIQTLLKMQNNSNINMSCHKILENVGGRIKYDGNINILEGLQ